MEKRKSNGADSGDLRASKRLRIVDKNTETATSTTQTGLAFLELIRKTSDKNGRRIATHFETLPPRRTNADYYKTVRMPISLQDVEKKLERGDFATLSELESFIKRMVLNAKEFYAKSSQQYEDAERVRKSTSNFMVKHNPAYKLIHGYSAVPTPIPDEPLDAEVAQEDEDDEADIDEGKDTEGEDAEVDDVDGEEHEDENEEAEQDDDGGEDEDEEDEQSKTPGRRKSSSARGTTRAVSVGEKQDGDYEGVPYQGLTFQQAQEKIMEEIIRRPDEEDENYAYFEPFFNLPSRTLKDYFQVIKDPLSIKKLQKLVKGIRSRTDRSGVTEFKSWAAFEDKASLLWENAYYYNEDGSVIVDMAKELEAKKMFRDELAQAKAVVQEPPQPKIKIKKTTATPASGKKITIHVANPRNNSTESATHKAVPSEPTTIIVSRREVTPAALDKMPNPTRSLPSAASPSPSVAATARDTKRESTLHASPTLSQRPSSTADAASGTITVRASSPATSRPAVTPIVPPKPAAPPRPAYESRFREQSRQPLVTNLAIKTHPALDAGERRYEIQLPSHPKLTQRSVTLNIPAGQWRQQLYVTLNPAIQKQQRPYKMFVISNGATLGPMPSPPPPSASSQNSATPPPPSDLDKHTHLYEINLHPGVNVIQVQLIVGLTKDQKLPNGADAELEKITVFASMVKF
ncbi:hypothetical protein SEPCBS119000_003199 [Sporothrix epigloea]|uniref:Bromo domain-containing protein n=1 Tax=Sporothrix epigloea TaxID=1892477 RepID=A0ABP0DLL8_9PEZI